MKDRLEEQDADVKASVNEVNKLNESYEAITLPPKTVEKLVFPSGGEFLTKVLDELYVNVSKLIG